VKCYKNTNIKKLEFKKKNLLVEATKQTKQKESDSGKCAAFKSLLLLYGAEKYIAATDINVLFLRVFLSSADLPQL